VDKTLKKVNKKTVAETKALEATIKRAKEDMFRYKARASHSFGHVFTLHAPSTWAQAR